MKRAIKKSMICLVVMCCLLIGMMISTMAAEPFEIKGDVTSSDTAYSMILSNSCDTFIYNKTPVDMKVGNRYYMVYTVEEITSSKLSLSGVSISKDVEQEYPYVDGTLKYTFDSTLFEEGATYFCRMEVTEEGLSYMVAKKEATESKWIELPLTATSKTEDCQYFGIWLGETVSARLSDVLCYDEKGNDLGITTHSRAGSTAIYDAKILKEQQVHQWYEFSLKDAWNLAISNEKPTDSDTVYISYTVENVQKNKATQAGIGHTTAPNVQFPHTNGLMNYSFCESSPFLEEGGKYLICAKTEPEGLIVVVKKTVNGKETVSSFGSYTGEKDPNAKFFYMWFGYGVDCGVTADIKEFRMYDKEGKNLGVQANQSLVITKYGDIEDYSLCEAIYWCEETNTSFIMDDEQNIGVKDESGTLETKWYKYRVRGAKLIMSTASGDVEYDYQYGFVKDTDGNKYVRLNNTKVTFVTGIKNHESNQTVEVTVESGYKVKKPSDPKVDGYTFKEWSYADGRSFDFERYVTDSVTLYAKYVDGDGHEYLVSEQEVENNVVNNQTLAVVISVGIILLTVAGVVLILIKGRQKNGRK